MGNNYESFVKRLILAAKYATIGIGVLYMDTK